MNPVNPPPKPPRYRLAFLRGAWQALIWWIRRAPWQAMASASLILTLLVYLLAVPEWSSRAGFAAFAMNSFWHAWVLGWMMLITWGTRTIGLREVISAWCMGVFTSVLLVTQLAKPLLWLNASKAWEITVVAPLLEEGVKAALLGLILLLAWRRRSQQHGIMDLVILGFAIGGGMSVHEDAMWGRRLSAGIRDGWTLLFPTSYMSWNDFSIVHSGWGALIGLGLGTATLLRRIPLLALGFALAGVMVAMLDHASSNLFAMGSGLLRLLLLNGHLAAWLLLLGILAALATEHWILLRSGRLGAGLTWSQLRQSLANADGWLERLVRVVAACRYQRARISASYAAWQGRAQFEDVRDTLGVLRRLALGRHVDANAIHGPESSAIPIQQDTRTVPASDTPPPS